MVEANKSATMFFFMPSSQIFVETGFLRKTKSKNF
jgi:hypothetical protein